MVDVPGSVTLFGIVTVIPQADDPRRQRMDG